RVVDAREARIAGGIDHQGPELRTGRHFRLPELSGQGTQSVRPEAKRADPRRKPLQNLPRSPSLRVSGHLSAECTGKPRTGASLSTTHCNPRLRPHGMPPEKTANLILRNAEFA